MLMRALSGGRFGVLRTRGPQDQRGSGRIVERTPAMRSRPIPQGHDGLPEGTILHSKNRLNSFVRLGKQGKGRWFRPSINGLGSKVPKPWTFRDTGIVERR